MANRSSLDAEAERILESIKQVESGGNYDAMAPDRGFGAYQFQPETWRAWSSEYNNGKPLPIVKKNQDDVARWKVKELLMSGYGPKEIAAFWNSGSATGWENKRGVNEYGVAYDVPNHVSKFDKVYKTLGMVMGPSEAYAADLSKFVDPFDNPGQPVEPRPIESVQKEASKFPQKFIDPFDDPAFSTKIQTPSKSQVEGLPIESTGTVWGAMGQPVASSHDPASIRTRVKQSFVDDPATKIGIAANARFPNLPPQEAVKRYWVENGALWYVDNDGVPRPEVGEGLGEGLKSFLAGAVGKSPVLAGATIGAVTGGIPGAIAGAGAGEAFRQGVGYSAFNEPKTPVGVASSVGKEMLGAATGETLARGVATPIMNAIGRSGAGKIGRLAASDYRSLNPTETQRLMDLGERFGIPINVAEATNSPSLINAFNLASTSPYAVSERIMQWAEQQRIPQLKSVIKRELDAIFPEESIFEAGRMGQQAATEGLGVLKQSREAMAGPYYEAARQSGAKVDISPVMSEIDRLLETAPKGFPIENVLLKIRRGLTREVEETGDSMMPGKQEMKGIIRDTYANIDAIRKVGIDPNTVRSDYGNEGIRAINRRLPAVLRKGGQPLDQVAADYGYPSGDDLFTALTEYEPRYKLMAQAEQREAVKRRVPVDDIGTLHKAKMEIDAMLKGPDADSISRETKRELMGIKDTLVTQLSEASPEYAQGMDAFKRGSELVNEFMYSTDKFNPNKKPPLSTLGRIVEKKQGEKVEDIPGMLFGPQSSPAVVEQAKRFIKGQDEDAWNALIRAHLQDRLDTAVKNSQGWGYGYKFKETVFGTPGQEKILQAAMDVPTYNRWKDFMDLLDVTNRVLYRNSRTTPLAITKELIEQEAGGIKGRLLELAGTRINLREWAGLNRKLAMPGYLDKIYDAMNDPGTVSQLSKIRQLSDPQKKAVEVVSLLGIITGENVIASEFFGANYDPGNLKSTRQRAPGPAQSLRPQQ